MVRIAGMLALTLGVGCAAKSTQPVAAAAAPPPESAPEYRVDIVVPETWQQQPDPEGRVVASWGEAGSRDGANCNLVVSRSPMPPETSDADGLKSHVTEVLGTLSQWVVEDWPLVLDGRPAHVVVFERTHELAEGTFNLSHLQAVTIVDGVTHQMTCTSPTVTFAERRATFEAIVGSWRLVEVPQP